MSTPELDAGGFQRLSGCTNEQRADLERYLALLTQYSAQTNLVSVSSLPAFWSRHVLDSWQVLAAADLARTWADLGSGAGLPGLVLAIFLKGVDGAEIELVESRSKRCQFLRLCVDTLALPARVHRGRAEQLGFPVDVVTARACAPLPRLLEYAEPWLRHGGMGLFLKSEAVEGEIVEARHDWVFDVEVLPSKSDARGRLIKLKGVRRAQ